MTQPINHEAELALRSIRGAYWRTWLGVIGERFVRAFWPLYSLIFAGLAVVLMGGLDALGDWALLGLVIVGLLAVWLLVRGAAVFHWPERADVIARLDASTGGAPIAALLDTQGTGGGDVASVALWRAHRDQMFAKAETATAVSADLRISHLDRYGLRYIALTACLVGAVFGSGAYFRDLPVILSGDSPSRIAPTWEGWITPPHHTDRPRMYMADLSSGELRLPVNSEITLRLYGDEGALEIEHNLTQADDVIRVETSGLLRINGEGGAQWQIFAIQDRPPRVLVSGPSKTEADGIFRQDFSVRDDYGVVSGVAQVGLNLAAIERRFGFSTAPDPRDDIVVDLPMALTGDRAAFTETIVEQFDEHPWAGLPVIMQLSVQDAAGQTGTATPVETTLSERAFYNPVAQAVIEMRRDVLWARENGPRVAQILRALTHRPDERTAGSDTYLGVRHVIRSLEAETPISSETQITVAESLWDIARQLEDGDLADAKEALARAQERLAEAIRQGASEEEIERLSEELRRAMDEYMQQAARARSQQSQDQTAEGGEGTQITQQDIDDLMARVEELLKEGRTEDALALLDALREMMDNMQVTEGDSNQGDGEGLQGLADTLRDQQQLSDEAFRDLQEQFDGSDDGDQGDLADRQQALRDGLETLRESLPNTGGDEALDGAGNAMDRAEEALRNDDLAGAIDGQAEAIEQLRDGMRGLAQGMSDDQFGQDRGSAEAGDDPAARDPLGRDQGGIGGFGGDRGLSPRAEIYNRARELMDELQNRSKEQSRSEAELEYLERLLQQFD